MIFPRTRTCPRHRPQPQPARPPAITAQLTRAPLPAGNGATATAARIDRTCWAFFFIALTAPSEIPPRRLPPPLSWMYAMTRRFSCRRRSSASTCVDPPTHPQRSTPPQPGVNIVPQRSTSAGAKRWADSAGRCSWRTPSTTSPSTTSANAAPIPTPAAALITEAAAHEPVQHDGVILGRRGRRVGQFTFNIERELLNVNYWGAVGVGTTDSR
jgi:hypothetical protein